jgi:two-component system response regulator RegX3
LLHVARVLVVEDEESWADALSYALRREGFEVAVAATGPLALSEYDRNGADLVLLDLMLPQMSGVEVCHELRARGGVPIIMVSARDSEVDKVVGLEIGADDYVTKPYSLRELLARIRAVLRRCAVAGPPPCSVLSVGPIEMDVERHQVRVNGAEAGLTLKEFQLLELMLRNAGLVLTRAQLVDRVWGPHQHDGAMRTLDVHIKRLRSKVEPDPAAPRHLVTVRGVGYKFQA